MNPALSLSYDEDPNSHDWAVDFIDGSGRQPEWFATLDEALAFMKVQAEPLAPKGLIPVVIESVQIGNAHMDALDWSNAPGVAAICYEGEHLGIHFIVPGSGISARHVLRDMVDASGLYEVVDRATR